MFAENNNYAALSQTDSMRLVEPDELEQISGGTDSVPTDDPSILYIHTLFPH